MTEIKVEIRLNRVIEDDEEGNSYYFDIVANGQKAGTASVMANDEDDDYAYCDLIVVNPEMRNQGIGTAALQQISDRWYGVEVAPDNEDAQRLYERIGCESSWDNAAYVDQGYGVYRI